MKEMITVNHVDKSYGEKKVLNKINLTIYENEIFALVGANGAGKTTLLECMEGLRSYEGKITVQGKMGVQLQSSSLPKMSTCKELYQLFLYWNNEKKDEDLVKRLGVLEFYKLRYEQCSTGQKRRLHLLLAMITNPDILILDEPTAGLDIEGRIQIHKEIKRLKQEGKTIVLASHDIQEIEELCDRMMVLKDGSSYFQGSIEEIKMLHTKKHRMEVVSEGTEIVECEDVHEGIKEVLQRYEEQGKRVKEIHTKVQGIEEFFLELYKEEEQ